MKMDIICKKQDEYMTPPYAIKPILAYAPPQLNSVVPF